MCVCLVFNKLLTYLLTYLLLGLLLLRDSLCDSVIWNLMNTNVALGVVLVYAEYRPRNAATPHNKILLPSIACHLPLLDEIAVHKYVH